MRHHDGSGLGEVPASGIIQRVELLFCEQAPLDHGGAHRLQEIEDHGASWVACRANVGPGLILTTMPVGSVGTTATSPRPRHPVPGATAAIIQAVLSSVPMSNLTVILAGNRQWTILSGTRSSRGPDRRAGDSPMPAPVPAVPESGGTRFGTGLDGAAASGSSFFFFGVAALHALDAPIVPRALSALRAIRGVGIAPPFSLLPERPG
jgi:hypothetical protein